MAAHADDGNDEARNLEAEDQHPAKGDQLAERGPEKQRCEEQAAAKAGADGNGRGEQFQTD
jgi:hypothetical protein